MDSKISDKAKPHPADRQDPASGAKSDYFSSALIYLAALHGRSVSREALLAGLPITDDRLPPSLMERAAQRAGLETEAVKRSLKDIPALVLPCILILKDSSTAILLKLDLAALMATLVDPLTRRERQMRLSDLDESYLGYTFFVRPLITADERVRNAGDPVSTHWFWSVVRRFWANYSHIGIAALIINILALAAPLFIMNVYDRVVPNGAIPSLIALAVGLGIAIVFDFVLRTVRSQIIDMTGKTIDVVLSANIFEHVLALKLANKPPSVGILANQLRDFDSVREFFTSGTVISTIDLLFALLFIIVLFLIAGPLALIPLIMLPLMLAIGLVLQRPLDVAMKRLQSESSARHGVLVESLSSLETVRATGAEARMQTAWERSVAATARSSEDVHFWSSLALTISGSAQQISSLLLVVIGVFLILDGRITVGALVAANMLTGRVLAPISSIASVIARATQTFTAMKAIDKLMALPRERPMDRSYVSRSIEKGAIAFEQVTFKYPGAAVNALENTSFLIRPGERVGIIGRIGSGKTTVGRLICDFYDSDQGRILIDGIDLRQYDPANLRASIGFVLQDTDLFLGTMRSNITLGRPAASEAEIIEAARLAGVEQFVASHPLGYDMPIAEGGRSLSGGQKQAIGLARALIRKPRILFLDEPTSHFDVRSEAEFIERLKAIAGAGMTILISTHRPSLLNVVDRLLLFDQGRLVADGPRDKVIALIQGTQSQESSRGGQPPHARN